MFHGLKGELMQATTAPRDVRDDLFPHARLPIFLKMIGDAGNGLLARITGEEQGDLIRHVNHVAFFHAQSPVRASFCLKICVVIFLVSR